MSKNRGWINYHPERTCLNCKYEPTWSAWLTYKDPEDGFEFARCTGICKYVVKLVDKMILPACCSLRNTTIVRYSDDSGIKTNCEAWELKE